MTRTTRAAAAAILAVSGLTAVGCTSGSAARPGLQAQFQNVNGNNAWPERNGYLARQSVLYPFEVQQNNAQVLDGAINNTDFDPGTDHLNGVGRDKLDRRARKMPAPDALVPLQTAADVPYDEHAPERTIAARSELDQKRAQSVLAYLAARPNTRGMAFQVQPIDIAEPGTNSAGPAATVRGLTFQYKSSITGSLSNGNLVGAGGGQATNTLGVTPGQGQAQQGPPPGGGSITLR